jgi:hypothetical protein
MKRFQNLQLTPASSAGLLAATTVCWLLLAEAATYGIGACTGVYRQCLADWKADRIAKLKGEEGYLNLAGLFWLRQGISSFGSGADNDLVFPNSAIRDIGMFELDGNSVVMIVRSGADVRFDGHPVDRMQMADDTSDKPTVVTHGSLAWTVIRRDDRVAVRLRDFAHPALSAFPPLDYFPTDETLRVLAKLQRYARPKIVRIDTVVEGLDYNPSSPGLLQFDIAGQSFELEAYNAGEELLLVFGDTTSGRQTYPAGRFLYVSRPGRDGITVLDFNTAQNPPCAFNDFATCPVASPRNRLAIRVAAGERFDASGH